MFLLLNQTPLGADRYTWWAVCVWDVWELWHPLHTNIADDANFASHEKLTLSQKNKRVVVLERDVDIIYANTEAQTALLFSCKMFAREKHIWCVKALDNSKQILVKREPCTRSHILVDLRERKMYILRCMMCSIHTSAQQGWLVKTKRVSKTCWWKLLAKITDIWNAAYLLFYIFTSVFSMRLSGAVKSGWISDFSVFFCDTQENV